MPRGSLQPIPGRCAARIPPARSGDVLRYCTNHPIVGGNGRCRMHNGKAVAGQAHPGWKHGRYSKVLRAEYKTALAELMADPEVLSLVDNIRLVDVEIMRVTAALQDARVAADWDRGRLIAGVAIDALKAQDSDMLGRSLADLANLFDKGAEAERLRAEVLHLHDARRRLVRTEAARLAANRAAISIDRAIGVIMMLVDVMFRHVVDAATRKAIINDVRALELLPGQFAAPAEVPL